MCCLLLTEPLTNPVSMLWFESTCMRPIDPLAEESWVPSTLWDSVAPQSTSSLHPGSTGLSPAATADFLDERPKWQVLFHKCSPRAQCWDRYIWRGRWNARARILEPEGAVHRRAGARFLAWSVPLPAFSADTLLGCPGPLQPT